MKRCALVLLALGVCVPCPVWAQETRRPPAVDSARTGAPVKLEPLNFQTSRMGSGTGWLPDASRMHGYHVTARGWHVMVDGAAFVQYVRQFGTRRQWQLGSTNWLMGMADRRAAGGTLQLRAMLSAEPATLTAIGYPLLLQTAQPYRGGTLTDRQHPHELLSELAVRYGRTITRDVSAELYLAPAGEPAIGPVAYRHRPSAMSDPTTPLGHHAQDVTHTTFGVVTIGVFSSDAKIEASVFNGAHPDDDRTNLDYRGARLDSYAWRVTVNRSVSWSVSGSLAYIAAQQDPSHGGQAHGSLHRISASVLHTRPWGSRGGWSTALVYGVNVPAGTSQMLHALLLESDAELDERNTVFGRAEYVRRTAAELALTGSVSPELTVGAVSLGYARRLGELGKLSTNLGIRGTANFISAELEPFYGSRTPLGVFLYLNVRPNAGAAHQTPQHHARMRSRSASSHRSSMSRAWRVVPDQVEVVFEPDAVGDAEHDRHARLICSDIRGPSRQTATIGVEGKPSRSLSTIVAVGKP